MTIFSIERHNARLNAAQAELNRALELISYYQRQAATEQEALERTVRKYRQLKHAWRGAQQLWAQRRVFKGNPALAEQFHAVRMNARTYKQDTRERVFARKRTLRYNRAQHEHFQSRLPALHQAVSLAQNLTQENNTVSVDLTALRKAFSKHPRVWGIKAWVDNDANALRIRFCMRNQTMSCLAEQQPVAERIAKFIGEGGEDKPDVSAIPVPNMSVTLSYKANEDRWMLYGKSTRSMRGMPRFCERPHPHWITPSDPCLGDYGVSITEALNEGDYITAITLLDLFLGHYNLDDSAGIMAPYWALGEDNWQRIRRQIGYGRDYSGWLEVMAEESHEADSQEPPAAPEIRGMTGTTVFMDETADHTADATAYAPQATRLTRTVTPTFDPNTIDWDALREDLARRLEQRAERAAAAALTGEIQELLDARHTVTDADF